MSTVRRIAAASSSRVLVLAVSIALLAWLSATAHASVGGYSCDDPSKVYYGNQRLFQRPAHVDCDKVYAKISEYQEIVRRRLTDKDPQYHILLKKASERFSAAVKKMARSKNHDLVAQTGSVRKAKEKAKDVPDRTQAVIDALD